MDSREWREDPPLQSIEPLEILNLFEEHVKELEKEHEARMRRLKIDRVRAARKAREGFKVTWRRTLAFCLGESFQLTVASSPPYRASSRN